MNELQRLTTEYVEAEDRLRISGELSSNETVVMWLSQRLLIRLLPHLFFWLENQSSGSIPVELEQTFAQEVAKANISTEAPVQLLANSKEWLVSAVDLTPSGNGLCMGFRSADGQHETLTLQVAGMRQWLEITYKLWLSAEWPSNFWPNWIINDKQKDLLGSALSLH
ncbi:MAG: hypothetical protein ACSHXZ_04505 [Gammaproteobacteria bacterium]